MAHTGWFYQEGGAEKQERGSLHELYDRLEAEMEKAAERRLAEKQETAKQQKGALSWTAY